MLARRPTRDRADSHALAVLRDAVQPRAASGVGEETLEDRRLARGVAAAAAPLGAPEDEVDLRRGLDADPADAAPVGQVVRAPGPRRLRVLHRLEAEWTHDGRLRRLCMRARR